MVERATARGLATGHRSASHRPRCCAATASSMSPMSRMTDHYRSSHRCSWYGRYRRVPHLRLPLPLRKDEACSASLPSSRQRGAAVLRQANRAVGEFRGAGGHRDGERAADYRDARGVGAADRDRRGVAGHQFLARRPRAGVRRDAGKGDRLCEAAFGVLWAYEGERFARWRSRGVPRGFVECCCEPLRPIPMPGLALERAMRGETCSSTSPMSPKRVYRTATRLAER